MPRFNIARYQLDIHAPESEAEGSVYRWSESTKRVVANLPAMIESAEEDLTVMLPEGYVATIKELK